MCVTCIFSSWNHMNYTHTPHFCNRIAKLLVQLLISNLSTGHVKKLKGNPDWHKMACVHLEKTLSCSHPPSLRSLPLSLSEIFIPHLSTFCIQAQASWLSLPHQVLRAAPFYILYQSNPTWHYKYLPIFPPVPLESRSDESDLWVRSAGWVWVQWQELERP